MIASRVDVRKLRPELLSDFLGFFDGEAFADNPRWGFCYCQFLYVDHANIEWNRRTAEENRAAACRRIAADQMRGYLAYRDGKVVGWCNAAPRKMLDALAAEPDPDADRIGRITCFIVAKDHRRSGVAGALLEAACAGLKAEGLAIAEASPRGDGASSDAQNHYGPLSMYLAARFRVHHKDDDGTFYVRRDLL
jgi:ribosomal protein S18 acetylase RimI-like enzyme